MIERLSSMIEGVYCAIDVDGVVVNRRVYRKNTKQLYIKHDSKILFEDDLPLGVKVRVTD